MNQGQGNVPDCKFVLPRTFCGVKFSEDEMKEMLHGGSSRTTTFKLKNGKNLYCSMHLDNNGKLKPILIPIGTCPKCGGTVVRGTKSYYCVNNMKKMNPVKNFVIFLYLIKLVYLLFRMLP